MVKYMLCALCVPPEAAEHSLIASLVSAWFSVIYVSRIYPGGGALEWQEGVSGSSMDTQKAP